MEDRREHPRVAVPTVLLKIKDAEKFRTRYMKDLSKGGVFIQTQRVFPLGSTVKVELHAPGDDEPLRLEGEVVRVDRDAADVAKGMALRFATTDPETRVALDLLLERFGDLSESEPARVAAPPPEPARSPSTARAPLDLVRETLQDVDRQLQRLHEEIEQLEGEGHELRDQVQRLEQEKAGLTARNAELTAEIRVVKQDFTELREDVAELVAVERRKAEAAREELQGVRAELAELQQGQHRASDEQSELLELRQVWAASQEEREVMALRQQQSDQLIERMRGREAQLRRVLDLVLTENARGRLVDASILDDSDHEHDVSVDDVAVDAEHDIDLTDDDDGVAVAVAVAVHDDSPPPPPEDHEAPERSLTDAEKSMVQDELARFLAAEGDDEEDADATSTELNEPDSLPVAAEAGARPLDMQH